MVLSRTADIAPIKTAPRIPSWVTSGRSENLEDVAFLSGAALSHLHLLMARDDMPQTLVRARLTLGAAEACVKFSGRSERAGDLRDAIHFLRPGDLAGPAGDIYIGWQRAVARPVTFKSLHRAFPTCEAGQIAEWCAVGQGNPVARAAQVLERVLAAAPRSTGLALALADAALAQALGWRHITPLFAIGLKRADLRKLGTELEGACHQAVRVACIEGARLASDLSRKTAHLVAVAPKLRAKGAREAVEMFLTRDAVAAAELPLPPRAARRLCDRLVDLGAARELTGRDTFRLYGV